MRWCWCTGQQWSCWQWLPWCGGASLRLPVQDAQDNDTCGQWLMQYHMFVHGTLGINKQKGNVIPAVIYSAAFEVVAAAACMPAGA